MTGGSSGIGKAVARELIAEGARAVLVARDEAKLRAAADEIGAAGWVSCDTGSDAAVKAMAARAVEILGGVDILVNCAAQAGGLAPPPKLAEIDDGVFWPDVNVKVMGYLRCIRELVPHMAAGSRIVNVAGLAARSTGSTVGSIRNVGVAALTKNLAQELAPQGIAVVCVHPGTTRIERTPPDLKANNLLGRILDAREVAWTIAFLCSPRAVAVNGDAVVAGGGSPGSIHY